MRYRIWMRQPGNPTLSDWLRAGSTFPSLRDAKRFVGQSKVTRKFLKAGGRIIIMPENQEPPDPDHNADIWKCDGCGLEIHICPSGIEPPYSHHIEEDDDMMLIRCGKWVYVGRCDDPQCPVCLE